MTGETDKPWEPGRKDRRVLLVLLAGAGELSGYPISRAAQVGSGHVYTILGRLERLGWVESDWQQDPPAGQPGRRRFYRLTARGRSGAMMALGLKESGK